MKNYNYRNQRRKSQTAILVFSFIAVIAVMGVYTFTRFQSNMEEKLAESKLELQENTIEKFQAEIVNNADVINEIAEVDLDSLEQVMEEVSGDTIITPKLTFTQDSTLMWPVDGGVLMNYSMDRSIYFATLDQYKRNDAMIIAAELGCEVMASEYGVVLSIEESVETGLTVVVDMGGGYTAYYGQLEDVKVSAGNVVEKGQIIGGIAEPTRYYSVEGSNLYFKVEKDGEAIDPLAYLE